MSKRINILLCLLLFLSLFLLLIFPTVSSYFSQDDFHHLRTIMDKNFSDIPSFFVTWQEGQTFYRPLSREIFNLLMYKTFGLNPLPFHIVNVLQIILIAFLSYKLVIKILNRRDMAILTVFFYLITPIHSVELYYLGSVQQLFATIFLISSLLFFISYLRVRHIKDIILSVFLFLLALLSHPMAVMFVPMVLVVTLLERKSLRILLSKNMLLMFAPFVFLGIFYTVFSSLLNLPQQEVYKPVYSVKTMVNTLQWYVLWAFGLPEMMVDFIGPGLHINPNLIKWYKDYLQITISAFGFLVISLILIILKFRNVILKEGHLLFFALGFVISVSTFLAFPEHKFIFYMPFAAVWFAIGVSYLLSKVLKERYGKIWVLLIMTSFLIISWQTTGLNAKTHWAAKRAVAAKFLLENVKIHYPDVEKGTVFYFVNDPNYPNIAKDWGTSSKQAFYILSGPDSLKLLYKDSSINAYYEDARKLPKDIDRSKVVNLTAQFPL